MYDFENKLKQAIVSCSNDIDDVSVINENTDLIKDFNFDSINIIQLVVELESTFDIEIDDDNLLMERLSTYKSLVEIVHNSLNEAE